LFVLTFLDSQQEDLSHLKTMPKRLDKPKHLIDFKSPDDDAHVTFTVVEGRKMVRTATFSKIIEKMTTNAPAIGIVIYIIVLNLEK
jgi:hypothetical protein